MATTQKISAPPTPAPAPARVSSTPTPAPAKAAAPQSAPAPVYGFLDGSLYDASGNQTKAPTQTAPNTTTSTPAATGPNATPAGLGLSVPVDPNQAAIDKAQSDATSGYTAGAPDQETIRQNTLKGFQTQIDALDQAAATARADITTRYTKIGNERLGSNRALLAGAGMLGQVSGDSSQNQVTDANTQETSAAIAKSDADFTNQKNTLLGQARTMAVDEYNNKLQAYTQGANATVQYLRDKTTRAKENAVELAKSAIAKGINLADPKNANDLKTLAQQLGMSPDALIATYTDTKSATDAAKLKAAKDSQTTLSQGSKLVDANGKVIADNPAGDKFSAAKDAMGNPITFDSSTGKYLDNNGKVVDPAHTSDNVGYLDQPAVGKFTSNLTPSQAQVFNGLSNGDKSNIMSLVQGREDLTTLMASRGIQGSAARQDLINKVMAIDPTYSENRYTFRKQWEDPNGKMSTIQNAMNTALSHTALLKEDLNQMAGLGGDFKKANVVSQWIADQTNGKDLNPLVKKFLQDRDLLSHEVANIYANGNVADVQSIHGLEKILDPSTAPSTTATELDNSVNLIAGRLSSYGETYKKTMNTYPDNPIINSDALDALQNSGINTQGITKTLIQQGMKASSVRDYETAFPTAKATVDKLVKDNPNLSEQDVLQILQPDFSSVGNTTASNTSSVKTTAMRTDRNNNPTAMTTDVARTLGLVEGKDYVVGDKFPDSNLHTAKLLGDPIATTIKGLDQGGFYTQSGKQRWTHTAIPQDKWLAMSYPQKVQVVKQMYQREGGSALLNQFA